MPRNDPAQHGDLAAVCVGDDGGEASAVKLGDTFPGARAIEAASAADTFCEEVAIEHVKFGADAGSRPIDETAWLGNEASEHPFIVAFGLPSDVVEPPNAESLAILLDTRTLEHPVSKRVLRKPAKGAERAASAVAPRSGARAWPTAPRKRRQLSTTSSWRRARNACRLAAQCGQRKRGRWANYHRRTARAPEAWRQRCVRGTAGRLRTGAA